MSQKPHYCSPEEEPLHKWDDDISSSEDGILYVPAGFNEKLQHTKRNKTLLYYSIFNFCLFCAYVFATVKLLNKLGSPSSKPCSGPDIIYSPAREAVSYEAKLMNNSLFEENAFKGEPRPEQTAAWSSLNDVQFISVSKEDLDAINRSSIELPDGSGYLAQLDVFHELHCLYGAFYTQSITPTNDVRNLIREFVHRDYYRTAEAPDLRIKHVDHCFDTLRQILMCHGDISLVTFEWVEHHRNPFSDFLVQRECRNWDNLLDWTKKRRVSLSTLHNPIYKHNMDHL